MTFIVTWTEMFETSRKNEDNNLARVVPRARSSRRAETHPRLSFAVSLVDGSSRPVQGRRFDMPVDDDEVPTVWVIWGSQYVAKALVALDAHGIKHYVKRGKLGTGGLEDLPGGGKLVPVLTAGGDVVVPDSEAILRWAEKTRGANLYPTPQCAEWSERASDGFLPNAVLYYNWIEPEGYARSMRAKFASLVPWYAGGGTCIAGYLVDWGTAKKRAEFAEKVLPELSKHPDVGTLEGRADAVAKEHVIREALVKELAHFQSGLGANDAAGYLCGGDAPTAADCSVYAQLERLVGTMGDARVPASVPGLLDDTRLGAIKKWREMMVERHPIRYGGKRAPTEK